MSHASWALSDVCADHFAASAMSGSAIAEAGSLLRHAMQSAQCADSAVDAVASAAETGAVTAVSGGQSRVLMPVASPTVFWSRVVGAWLGARLQHPSPSSTSSSLSSHTIADTSSSYVPLSSSSASSSTSLLDAMLHTSALISANMLDESASASANAHRARSSAMTGLSLLSGATSAAHYESPLLLFRAFRNSRHFAAVAPKHAADSATYRYVHQCSLT